MKISNVLLQSHSIPAVDYRAGMKSSTGSICHSGVTPFASVSLLLQHQESPTLIPGIEVSGQGLNRFKVQEGRFILDIVKKSFTLRVMRHWHRLSREAEDPPSLEVFKAHLEVHGA